MSASAPAPLPRDVSSAEGPVSARARRCARPGTPPRPSNSDPAATDIYTHREFAPRCAAPSDRPSSRAEVGGPQVPQQRAPNAPQSEGGGG